MHVNGYINITNVHLFKLLTAVYACILHTNAYSYKDGVYDMNIG